MGWPYNTLLRFHFFGKIAQILEGFDFTFFFNANMLFNDDVNEDFLPNNGELLATRHPSYLPLTRASFPYEQNPLSTAYIRESEGLYYFMGGLNGGDSKEFNQLICILRKNIDIDLANNIIAQWHDESHLNHYLLNAVYKILPENYVFIESENYPTKPKLIIRDKSKFGGHNYLRKIKISRTKAVLDLIKRHIKKIIYL